MLVVAILIQGVMSKSDDAVSNISRVVRRHHLNKGLKHQVRFVNDLAKNCVGDECDILHTLLRDRGNWHPAAPTVLEKVSSRRLSSTRYCHDRATEDVCTKPALVYPDSGECKVSSCVWVDRDGYSSCWEPECELYTSSEACCDNADNVPSGCYWNANSGECVAPHCHNLDESTCASMKACKFECDDCHPVHYTECEPYSPGDSHCSCGPPEDPGGDYDAQQNALINCPAMGCSMCLKGWGGAVLGSSGMSVDKEKVKELYKGTCNQNCTDIAQCEAEAVCLMSEGTGSGSGSGSDDSEVDLDEYEQCKVMPSCPSEFTTSTTTSLSSDEMCAQTCDEFDKKCNTCGGAAPCGSSSGARRVAAGKLDTIGSFMLSVLGMILFVHTS